MCKCLAIANSINTPPRTTWTLTALDYSSFEGFGEAMSTTGYAYTEFFTLTSNSH